MEGILMKYFIISILFTGVLLARGISDLDSKMSLAVSRADYLEYTIASVASRTPASILAKTSFSRFDIIEGAIHTGIYRENSDSLRAQVGAAYLVRVSQIQQGLAGQAAYDFLMQQIDFGFYCYLYSYRILKDTSYLSASEKSQIVATIYAATKHIAENAIRDGKTTNRNGWIISGAGANESLRMFPSQPDFAYIKQIADNQWALLDSMGDADEEATHYNGLEIPYLLKIAESRGVENSFYADPDFNSMIERYRDQISPFGIIPNYGDSYWASLWGTWLGIFEKAAVVYNDGQYRTAAHKIFNYARAQSFRKNDIESLIGIIFAMEYMDSSISPKTMPLRSQVNNRRYRQDVPDKLTLRNGSGYVHMNLYYGGTHGHPDGSAITGYIDGTGVLLRNHNRPRNTEEFRNMLIIRDREENFPFIERQFLAGKWQHSAIEMDKIRSSVGPVLDRSNITALNFSVYDDTVSTTFDFYIDNIKAVKADGTALVIENFENGANGWSGVISSDAFEGTKSLKKNIAFTGTGGEVSRLYWPSTVLPLNIADYQSLEFAWKMTDNRIDPYWGAMLQFGSPGTQGSIRGLFTMWLRTMRMPQADLVKDYGRVSFGGVNTKIVDYLGGRNTHRRDMLLSGGKLFWVRDEIEFSGDESCKVGPVWHVGAISQSGTNWFRTYQDPVYGDWKAGVKDCIVYFLGQSDMTTASGIGTTDDPQYAVYQFKDGDITAGTRVHFNTLFIPLDASKPSDVVNGITTLFDNERAAAIKIQAELDNIIASQSTSQNLYESDDYGTDALRAFIQYSTDIDYICAYSTTVIRKDGLILFGSQDSRADVEIEYNNDQAKIYSASGTVAIASASLVTFYFPDHPDVVEVNGQAADFQYNQSSKQVSIQLNQTDNAVKIYAGNKACVEKLAGDVNKDCIVDFFDLSRIGLDWLVEMNIFSDLSGNGIVDYGDFSILAYNWLAEYGETSTALWLFDESGGDLAYDSTGGFNGTVTGNYDWLPFGGINGGAIRLYGNGSSIDVPDFNLVKNWQISADIKVAVTSVVMLCGNNLDANNYIYLQGSSLRFRNNAGTQISWALDKSLTNLWVNIKLAADDNGIEVFLDGISQGRQSISPDFKFYAIGSGHTLNSYDFQGLMDNFNLYISES